MACMERYGVVQRCAAEDVCDRGGECGRKGRAIGAAMIYRIVMCRDLSEPVAGLRSDSWADLVLDLPIIDCGKSETGAVSLKIKSLSYRHLPCLVFNHLRPTRSDPRLAQDVSGSQQHARIRIPKKSWHLRLPNDSKLRGRRRGRALHARPHTCTHDRI